MVALAVFLNINIQLLLLTARLRKLFKSPWRSLLITKLKTTHQGAVIDES